MASKRKVDQQLASLQGEYEELESEGKENSEKLHKATELIARYQSEVMTEKESANALEKARVCVLYWVEEGGWGKEGGTWDGGGGEGEHGRGG